MKKSDIIIVGTGVAGLSFTITIAEQRPDLKLTVLTKSELTDSNSNYAQGGIASVMDRLNDSFDSHIMDTIASGGGLSDPDIVNLVVRSGPARIAELKKYGVQFTKDSSDNFDLALEGGHSKPRVVHANDNTGEILVSSLLKKVKTFKNVTLYDHHLCIDLLKTKSGIIGGISALNKSVSKVECFCAKIIVLATGGLGQIYQFTTNPAIATGDAIAMAWRAGVMVSNLNYIQFHPTALNEKNAKHLFLISEALRGFGAKIVNEKGERFLFQTDTRGELATRDIVSLAIYNELKEHQNRRVYLDCSHLDEKQLKQKFPSIYTYLIDKGFDVKKDLIPITPAAHYQCGGIKVNERGQTNFDNLYAIGECAETGLHGSNRLASNSLLEALVFAHESAEFVLCTFDDYQEKEMPESDYQMVNAKKDAESEKAISLIKETMSKYVAINSNLDELRIARNVIDSITRNFELHKKDTGISEKRILAENNLIVAQLVIQAKMNEYKTQGKEELVKSY